MKKIIITTILFLLVSCAYDYDPWVDDAVKVTSDSIFSIGGELMLSATCYPPVTVYNPNVYEITILCNETEYEIQGYEEITIETGVSK